MVQTPCMQEFRILGPLEVRSEEGPIALGGPRQRALLTALLLRAGRVVPTEQLVDELYGADPPPTATAALQNAVVALRKALGPDVLVTRPPGYVLAVSPEQIDARRFERLLADARAGSPEERRALLLAGARPLARPGARRVRLRGLGADRGTAARRASPCRRGGADRDRHRARAPRRRRPGARVARPGASAARAALRAPHARAVRGRPPGRCARRLRRSPGGARRARPRAGRGRSGASRRRSSDTRPG